VQDFLNYTSMHTMTQVTVIGNTYRNLGAACAADMALAGHAVRYALYPDQAAQFEPVKKRGGFLVEGDPANLVSQRTGFAQLKEVSNDPPATVADAEVVLLDLLMPDLERRFLELIPHLPRDVVVHVQGHGYWLSARLTPLLRAAGRNDVLVTDAAVPTISAHVAGDVITAKGLRKGVEVGTTPGNRIGEALKRLHTLFPDFQPAPSSLQVGLENANLLVHPAMILLGIGQFEQAGLKGQGLRFYTVCNVPSAGVLADALDAERGRVCLAYGVRHKPMWEHLDTYYGTPGKNAYDAISQCKAYQSLGDFSATVWRDWESIDVPYALVPLVRLAEQAGLAAPLHRAVAEILGTLLGMDPWTAGPTLSAMGLEGKPADIARRFRDGS